MDTRRIELLQYGMPGGATPLPSSLRLKWLAAQEGQRSTISLEMIESRLEAASEKRREAQALRRVKMTRHTPKITQQEDLHASRALRLEEKLIAAAQLRTARLEGVSAKAAATSTKVEEARAREDAAAAARRTALFARLRRAEMWRKECLDARAHSQAAHSPEGFLQKRALPRALLRRQHSSRKLQRFWHQVYESKLTTHHLAATFIRTGVLGVHVDLPPPPPPQIAGGTNGHLSAADVTTKAYDNAVAIPGARPDTSPLTSPIKNQDRGNLIGAESCRSILFGNPAMPTTPGGSPERQRLHRSPPPAAAVEPVTAAHVEEQDPFERFAAVISRPKSLAAAAALLRRLESKRAAHSGGTDLRCEASLQRLFPAAFKGGRRVERYPTRIIFCAYMIKEHPKAVFSQRGAVEAALTRGALAMLAAFEELLLFLAQPASVAVGSPPSSPAAGGVAGRSSNYARGLSTELLAAFDEAWVTWLQQFAAWKCADAASLESELIRVASDLERSMLLKVGPDMGRVRLSADLAALVTAVAHDQDLLRERVRRLTGTRGLARLHAALTAARAAVAAEQAVEASAAALAAAAAVMAQVEMVGPNGGELARGGAAAEGPQTPPRGRNQSRPSRPVQQPHSPLTAAGPRASIPASQHSISFPMPGRGASASGSQAVDERLGMLWELLHDPQWQLPVSDVEATWRDALGETVVMQEPGPDREDMDPTEVAAAVRRRIARIAEQAFWDSQVEALAAADSSASAAAAAGIASLLAELGGSLLEVLPQQDGTAARAVRSLLEPTALRAALLEPTSSGGGGGALGCGGLLAVLQGSAELLRELGAPARSEAALAAAADVQRCLAEAAPERAATARVVVRALRLLFAQLKLLKLDAANARLRMLSATLGAGVAAEYARTKFAVVWGISTSGTAADTIHRLPHARAWMAAASGQLPIVEGMLAPLGAAPAAAGNPSAPSAPTNMRTGRGVSAGPGSLSAGGGASLEASAAQLLAPASPRSWQGLVRLGLVVLAASPTEVAAATAPETLRADVGRLVAAQNDFQQLLVLAACSLLMQRVAAANRRPLSAEEAAAAKARLVAVLGDPRLRLPDIAAEVVRSAGGAAAEEAAVKAILARMLNRQDPAFKALCSGLITALQILLLRQPAPADCGARDAVREALARCGAGGLAEEVRRLAGRLGAVAAVSEAVHAGTYIHLAKDLLALV